MYSKGTRVLVMLLALFALAALVGCKGGSSCEKDFDDGSGSGGGGGGGGGSYDTPSTVAEAATDEGPDAIASVRERMKCASPKDMFEYVNYTRQEYSFHARNYGYPFSSATSGGGWSTTFSWSNQLADTAQKEAERLAAGGSPKGRRCVGNYNEEPFWMDAIETSNCRVSAKSDPKYKTDSCSHPRKWHSTSNNNYRQGIAYQGGTGSQVSKLGVGMAECGDGCVWWVLQWGN